MRVTDIYKKKQPVISMEFFPYRDEKTAENFKTTIDELSTAHPDYVSVTFGAGGSTKDGSFQTVKTILKDTHLPCVAYIAGFGLSPGTSAPFWIHTGTLALKRSSSSGETGPGKKILSPTRTDLPMHRI